MADTEERDTQADVSNLAMECNTPEDQPINKNVISNFYNEFNSFNNTEDQSEEIEMNTVPKEKAEDISSEDDSSKSMVHPSPFNTSDNIEEGLMSIENHQKYLIYLSLSGSESSSANTGERIDEI